MQFYLHIMCRKYDINDVSIYFYILSLIKIAGVNRSVENLFFLHFSQTFYLNKRIQRIVDLN